MTKDLVKIEKEEWYREFLEECRAIIIETKFNSTIELLRGKWELGKRIMEEELNFQRAGYGEKIIERISQDLEVSSSGLWKCVQFFKKFQLDDFEKVVGKLPGGKDVSWYKVCQDVLPEPRKEDEAQVKKEKECSHRILFCKDCGKEFSLDDLKKWLTNI